MLFWGGGLKWRDLHKLISRAVGGEVPLLTRAFARACGCQQPMVNWGSIQEAV